MNRLSVLFLIFLFSCSSHRPQQTQIPHFDKDAVCSPEARAYIVKYPKFNAKPRYTHADSRPYVLKLQPFVQACHQQEMSRTGQQNSYNLCLVVGLDKKGYKEFFQFSTTEIVLTNEMKKCLDDIKLKADFGKLQDLTIVEPFRLFP
jgi:hypothetical protein